MYPCVPSMQALHYVHAVRGHRNLTDKQISGKGNCLQTPWVCNSFKSNSRCTKVATILRATNRCHCSLILRLHHRTVNIYFALSFRRWTPPPRQFLYSARGRVLIVSAHMFLGMGLAQLGFFLFWDNFLGRFFLGFLVFNVFRFFHFMPLFSVLFFHFFYFSNIFSILSFLKIF
jgi:hypothetical protein